MMRKPQCGNRGDARGCGVRVWRYASFLTGAGLASGRSGLLWVRRKDTDGVWSVCRAAGDGPLEDGLLARDGGTVLLVLDWDAAEEGCKQQHNKRSCQPRGLRVKIRPQQSATSPHQHRSNHPLEPAHRPLDCCCVDAANKHTNEHTPERVHRKRKQRAQERNNGHREHKERTEQQTWSPQGHGDSCLHPPPCKHHPLTLTVFHVSRTSSITAHTRLRRCRCCFASGVALFCELRWA